MSLITALSVSRAAVGAGGWLAPGLAARVLGLDAVPGPRREYLIRLFAVRDLALAVGLQLSRGNGRRLWLQLGVLCDGADALAAIVASREAENRAMLVLSVPALTGVGLGMAALQAPD